jgi:hypothetical protein
VISGRGFSRGCPPFSPSPSGGSALSPPPPPGLGVERAEGDGDGEEEGEGEGEADGDASRPPDAPAGGRASRSSCPMASTAIHIAVTATAATRAQGRNHPATDR